MSSSGSPTDLTPTRASRALSVGVLLIAGGVVVAAAVLGAQMLGILLAIASPPLPPLPPGAALMRHTSSSYGVDDWLYRLEGSACKAAAFYHQHSALCPAVPEPCQGLVPSETLPPRTHVVQCSGDVFFSLFAMRWSVNIAASEQDGGRTLFRLTREIFWGGQIPPDAEALFGAAQTP